MIYQKVLEYQSKHGDLSTKYHQSSKVNGAASDSDGQEATSGLFVISLSD